MKYWFDTEFHEDGKTIDLISIGIVAEDGRLFYRVSTDFNGVKAFEHEWLRLHVLPWLPWLPLEHEKLLTWVTAERDWSSGFWANRKDIRTGILQFCDPEKYGKPEFWAYYADYDWVALCQLFGTMMDLPKDWPMYCRDIKQEADRIEAEIRWFNTAPDYKLKLPEQNSVEHHALADARWNKRAYDFVMAQSRVVLA
jgi:hypothetical protein